MNTDPATSPVNVTIPCSSCGESIRFAERECAGCGVKVSQAERDALDRRLEASSSDYRDLRKETDAGRTVMFIVAALHLLMAGVSVFVSEGEGGVIASAGGARPPGSGDMGRFQDSQVPRQHEIG